jgi:hypothetical protein
VFGRPGDDLLSQVLRHSTIGAEAFDGRVRDGIGSDRFAEGHQAGETHFEAKDFLSLWIRFIRKPLGAFRAYAAFAHVLIQKPPGAFWEHAAISLFGDGH